MCELLQYTLQVLFKLQRHLNWNIQTEIPKSSGNMFAETASTILYKYFGSVLISLAESSSKSVRIDLNRVIRFSQFSSSLPIVSEDVYSP